MTDNSLGLIGAHHIGITVPDLDQAIASFRDVLGLEPLVHSAPDQVRLAILPCLGSNVELLEYSKPGGLGAVPAPSSNGATSRLERQGCGGGGAISAGPWR
jgi:catechol 2,3-dioxygenase-like lactoylglutathione lyase family enzyme